MTKIKRNSSPKKDLVINHLVVRKLNRNILDVGKWRNALKSADNGRRQLLYELYEDILLDPVLSGAISKRINAITNAEVKFINQSGDPVDEMDQLIDSPAFEDLISEILQSRFWGKTVCELDFSDYFDIYSIPRTHLIPEKGIITINVNDDTGIEYRGDDFFIEAGKDKDFGLLLKASPFAIFKRGGFSDWAQFCELFGIPKTIGKYSGGDTETKKALEESFTEYGSAAWMLVPKETDIEMKESSTRGEGNLFDNFRKACNEEILITILGQTMTTVAGSSRAQSETHKEVEEDINTSDRRFVRRILNRELLPRLEKRGFPVAGGMFTFPETGEAISLTDQIDIDDKLVNRLGLDLDEDFLFEHYNRPRATDKPAKGKRTNREPAVNKEKEKEKLSDRDESFLGRFLSFFVKAPERSGAADLTGDLHISRLSDFPEFNIKDLAEKFFKDPFRFDRDLFNFTADALLKAIALGFSAKNLAMQFEYGFTPDAYKTAMEINLFHFSASKDLAQLQEFNKIYRDSSGWYDFYRRVQEVSAKFNKTWLQTEYYTANNVAMLAADYHRFKAQIDIFPYWQYVTVNDGKVRPEHAALHGLILPADDPLWDKIFPPNGWNCRCGVRPLTSKPADVDIEKERARVEEYFKTKDWEIAKGSGFGINRALTGEVFTANQMYIRKFPTKAAADLKRLTADKWGLEAMSKKVAEASAELVKNQLPASEIWKAESQGSKIALKLYNNRIIELQEKAFSSLIRRTDRVELWKALKETLSDPDEIWLNDFDTAGWDNFSLIRYYKKTAVVADYNVEKGQLKLKAWETLKPDKPSREKRRRGLLIKHG